MIVKMIKNLENRMEKMQEMFINKDLQELENKETMKNNTVNEIKNSLEDSGRAHAKEYFPELLLPTSLSPQ